MERRRLLLVVRLVIVAMVLASCTSQGGAVAVSDQDKGWPMSVADVRDAAVEYDAAAAGDGDFQVERIVIDGKPPLVKMQASTLPEPFISGATSVLSNVPAFDWSYGCSATAAAMLFGYYDNAGYPNMYTGPTNSGVCPMTNAVWGQTVYPGVTCGECPLSASHLGVDGRTIKGHVDDYWVDYLSLTDPFTGNWTEHTPADSLGDFMGTNQAKYGNSDGSTSFYYDPSGSPLYDYIPLNPSTGRDGCHGLHLFAESRGYTVVTNFTQLIEDADTPLGFTFEQFKNEIDAGRPVLIHVTGHTMLAYGYNTVSQTIQIHDTWDYSPHTMTWGDMYSGLQQWGVTVIRLAPVTSYTLTVSTSPTAGGTVAKSPDQATYTPGTVVALTASANPGYHFQAWSGSTTGTTNPVNVPMDGNKNVTATFAPNDVTVTVASGGNGTVTPVSSFTQTYGASGTAITASPATGYHFVSWSATSNPSYVTIASPTSASTSVTTTSSAPDGGTATVTATFAIDYGEPKSTHTWLDYPAGTTDVRSYSVDVRIDDFPSDPDPAWLYYFAIQTDFSDGGGGAHGGLQWASGGRKANWGGYNLRWSGDTQSIVVDQPWTTGTWYRYRSARGAQQPDSTWAWGFWITNLSTNAETYLGVIYSKGSSISGCVVWMETGYGVVATTPRAQVRWRAPAYTYGAGQTSGSPVAGYATYNGTCVEPHTTDQQLISASPREWVQLTNAAVRTTAANTWMWKAGSYNLFVSCTPSVGGTVTHSPDLVTYPSGTLVTLTASANPGYVFTGWTGDLTGSANPANITMSANRTVTARFDIAHVPDEWASASNGLDGGTTSCLAVDPNNTQVVYAGTWEDGVYKTVDGGVSWTRLDLMTSARGYAGALSLAISPSDTQVVYAGAWDGVWKSANSGASWIQMKEGLAFPDVRCIAVDPAYGDVLYVGTNGGVFKSTNGGTTWSLSGSTFTRVSSLGIDPTDTQVVYAGTWAGGVYRSANGGTTWTQVNGGLTVTDVYSLAIDPTNTQVVYAGTWAGGIYKSINSGSTWSQKSIGLPYANTSVYCLIISPQDSTTLYAGTSTGGIAKSTNGGASWALMNNGLPYSSASVYSLAIDPANSQVVFAGTYLCGTLKSTDGGSTWMRMNQGRTSTSVTCVTVDFADSMTVYAGTQYGGVFKSTNSGASWNQKYLQDSEGDAYYFVSSLGIARTAAQTLYAGTWDGGIFKSTDGGDSWIQMNSGLTVKDVRCLAIDPANAQVVFVGTYRGGAFKSTNGGTSWTQINSGLTQVSVYALAIDPTNTQVVYAGTERYDGTDIRSAFKSTNGGASWTQINNGLTESSSLSLAIDPANAQVVYAGTNGYVFKSTNGGTSWMRMANGLANLGVTSLTIDPGDTQVVYAGTRTSPGPVTAGVFRSLNGGASWSQMNDGLTDTSVLSLAIDPADPSVLYAGTVLGGVFRYEGALSPSVPVVVESWNGIWRYWIQGVPAPHVYGTTSMTPLLGDWDGDSVDEPVVVESWSGTLRFWCEGAPSPIVYGAPGMTVLMGDMDGDGTDEPVVVESWNGIWRFWCQGLPSPIVYGTTAMTPLLADTDGDGTDEPTVVESWNGIWRFWCEGAPSPIVYGTTAMTPLLGDWDGCGTDEPIVVESWSGTLRFWCEGNPSPIVYGAPGMRVLMGRP